MLTDHDMDVTHFRGTDNESTNQCQVYWSAHQKKRLCWATMQKERKLCQKTVFQQSALCTSTADCPPSLLKLFVQLGCLHDTNEHEDKSTPCAQNLDGPPTGLCWENGKLQASAITLVPEIIPTHVTLALSVGRPRREGSSVTGVTVGHQNRAVRTA